MNKLEFIRGLVRPFISVSFVMMIGWLAYKGEVTADQVLGIGSVIFAFHFGEKAALKKPDRNETEISVPLDESTN